MFKVNDEQCIKMSNTWHRRKKRRIAPSSKLILFRFHRSFEWKTGRNRIPVSESKLPIALPTNVPEQLELEIHKLLDLFIVKEVGKIVLSYWWNKKDSKHIWGILCNRFAGYYAHSFSKSNAITLLDFNSLFGFLLNNLDLQNESQVFHDTIQKLPFEEKIQNLAAKYRYSSPFTMPMNSWIWMCRIFDLYNTMTDFGGIGHDEQSHDVCCLAVIRTFATNLFLLCFVKYNVGTILRSILKTLSPWNDCLHSPSPSLSLTLMDEKLLRDSNEDVLRMLINLDELKASYGKGMQDFLNWMDTSLRDCEHWIRVSFVD